MGLPVGTARRTSGPRREALAVLAGVSVDCSVRLEQGRAFASSVQVCAALTRALQLSDIEQEHFLRLAGHATGGGRINEPVPVSMRRLVERTKDRAVAVFDGWWSLLTWAVLLGRLSQLRAHERSILRPHFVGFPTVTTAERATPSPSTSMVADLHRSADRCPDEPHLRELPTRLQELSASSCDLWQRHEIAKHGPMTKVIEHPDGGWLDLDCDILTTQRGVLRVAVYGGTGQ